MDLNEILLKDDVLTEEEYKFLDRLITRQANEHALGSETYSKEVFASIFSKIDEYDMNMDYVKYTKILDGLIVKKTGLTDEDYEFIDGFLKFQRKEKVPTNNKHIRWMHDTLNAKYTLEQAAKILSDMDVTKRSDVVIKSQHHLDLLTQRELDKTDRNNHNLGIYKFLPKIWKDKIISVRSRVNAYNKKAISAEKPPMIDKFKESYPYFWFVKEDEKDYAQKLVEDLYIKGQKDPELLDLYKMLKLNTPFVTDYMIDGEHDNFIRSKFKQ